MPAQSFERPTVGQFHFSINLPSDSFIKDVHVHYMGHEWSALIVTTKGQHAPILAVGGGPMRWQSLDEVARFLALHGIADVSLDLFGLIEGGAA